MDLDGLLCVVILLFLIGWLIFSVLKENQLYFSSFCRVQSLKTLYQCYYQEP